MHVEDTDPREAAAEALEAEDDDDFDDDEDVEDEFGPLDDNEIRDIVMAQRIRRFCWASAVMNRRENSS